MQNFMSVAGVIGVPINCRVLTKALIIRYQALPGNADPEALPR